MITVFVKIYKNLHTYEATGSFEGWIRRIASFESISFIRSQKRYSFVAPLDSETSDMDDVHMETNIDLEYLHWMLSQIPEGCRTIFMLYAVDGYKHQEIAEMLNISEGTSKSQVAYARKLLKILLSKEKIV
jgi:RNA polymerase sigma-70 factor (ECF subfamily)